jgi:RNase P subunit RPR2
VNHQSDIDVQAALREGYRVVYCSNCNAPLVTINPGGRICVGRRSVTDKVRLQCSCGVFRTVRRDGQQEADPHKPA